MAGKRGKGILYWGFKKPKEGDDDFEIYQLEATIKFIKSDLEASDRWIADYNRQLVKFEKNAKMRAYIIKMRDIEIKSKEATLEALKYYEEELAEEKAKLKP